ncbi:MAG TPA: hypothetical protein VGM37_06800 [Armatimonadota bacterium]|jgi:hypothetical protein
MNLRLSYLGQALIALGAAAALTCSPAVCGSPVTASMGGGSYVPPGAAQHSTGYAVVSYEQGETAGDLSILTINPTTHALTGVSTTRLKSNNNTLPVFGTAAPVLVAKDPTHCYAFAMETNPGEGSNPGGLYYFFINNGAQEKNLQYGNTIQHFVRSDCLQNNTTFGACATPDGAGVIVVTSKSISTATVAFYSWSPGADSSLTPVIEADVPLAAGSVGNVSCAVTRNTDEMARWYPFRLTLASNLGNGTVVTRAYRLNTKILANTNLPVETRQRYYLTGISTDPAWNVLTSSATGKQINVHQGLDGRVYVAVPSPSGVLMFARTGFDAVTQAEVWAPQTTLTNAAYGNMYSVPCFVYKPQYNAAAPTTPFPINRVAFFVGAPSGNTSTTGYDDSFGYGRRRQMADGNTSTQPISAGVAIGIVEGAPPIPDENLNIWPGGVSSSFQFAATSTSTASTNATLGQGVTVGASGSLGGEIEGFGASVDVEAEMSQRFSSTYSTQQTSTSEQYLNVANAASTDGTGKTVSLRLGTIFLAKIDYSGYVYEFGTIDNGGNFTALPGSILFTQVFAKGGYNIVPRTWYMNPNGPQPGDLQSYMVSPDELNALNSPGVSKIAFHGLTGNTNYIYFSFENASSAHSAFDYFQSVDSSQEEEVSTKESLKVSAKTPIASASVSASQDTDITRGWGIGSGSQIGISTATQVQNDSSPSAAPNYYSETYQVYLLKDNNAYLRELLSDDPNGIGMVTPTWPPIGSIERQRNEQLKAELVRTSTPWKVKYVVTQAKKNTGLAAPPPGGPTLQSAMLQKLNRFGVTTTGLLDIVVSEAEALRRPGWSLNTVPLGRYISRQATQDATRRAALLRYWPGTTNQNAVHLLISSLSTADIASIRAYLNGLSASDRAAWTAAHPGRYTARNTVEELARPAIHNVRERFTEVPPAQP